MTRSDDPAAGAVEVAAEVLCGGVSLVEATHRAIADTSFGALALAPGTREVGAVVQQAHHGIAALAYAGVRAGLRLGGAGLRLSLAARGEAARAPASGSLADLAVSALNGFAGDRLARERHPLATPMSLRSDGRAIEIERAALAAAHPDASPRLALFVHGLACNETLWWRDSLRHYGVAGVSYGSRLRQDLGWTPVYLRYNSGLAIAENGRALAELLDRLLAAWPGGVERLALIGHSMGGLVIRSAAHYGRNAEWAARTRHIVYLGSPHLGAPLEKAAEGARRLLALTDITRPLAEVVDRRSRGIKDLRTGALLDDSGSDAWSVPLLAGASHHAVAATVTRDRRHPLALLLGDLLVREASAVGAGPVRRIPFPADSRLHLGALTHLELLNHPLVYQHLLGWLRQSSTPSEPRPSGSGWLRASARPTAP